MDANKLIGLEVVRDTSGWITGLKAVVGGDEYLITREQLDLVNHLLIELELKQKDIKIFDRSYLGV